MPEGPSSSSIKLAIIGGGLAGVTLANALAQHDHIKVHVYESAPQFSARGAAVGLAVNAQNALHHILPQAGELLENAGGVPMNSTRVMVGAGEYMNQLARDHTGTKQGLVFHRASLLRELLRPLPEECLHANKKLASISEKDGKLEVRFTDETSMTCDAVVGADGIFSAVRDHVVRELQDSQNDWRASAAGFWDCRNLVPFERAKATLGEEYFEMHRQYVWVNDGAVTAHDVCENGNTVQCVICAVESDPPQDRSRPLTRELLETTLESSLNRAHTQGMIELLLDQPSPKAYSEWEHKATPTYASGRVCIVGDAAHSTTPWQGSGAGLAIEDAMVLAALLAHVRSANEVEAAFRAFSDVRLPRCQKVIDSSRETGTIFCGRYPAAGLDPERLNEALTARWQHIHDLDHDGHISEALVKFEVYRKTT
ncbi:salicylate hydroxylase [Xylaria bambusicola]|uniref:salicylate hydroxylase n=1 Tax=Xylaria bambusicola TaxID=326684 RepID=UPI002007E762|nr:salicylate hydroxylase [Xylaria bambusicola]KAI0505854.1 salicylate hydroxylase [Xylaria bambusicola]